VVFELFYDLTPRTAENFRGLCTGEYGIGKKTKKPLHYTGCSFFRSVKDFMVQTGDFQFNNGDGGESIYGGTFNDEDFSRRHTQGGVLSMANKGRNTNGSQFFITLKRCPRLDNKHIAFGQVVDGMDVIRAISKVPIDRDEKPRVPIMIVGSGELGTKNANQADPTLQMSNQIAKLQEEAFPTDISVNNAEKAKAILKGAQGGAAIEDEKASSSSSKPAQESDPGAGMAPPRNDRERKLYELRMKMNAGRTKNNKEVIEEQKRNADPDYARKQAEARHKRGLEEEAKKDDPDGLKDSDAKSGALPKGKDYLNDTVEQVEMREAKKKKKGNPDAFGWDVFNQDSLYNAHDKRLKHVVFDEQGYKDQQEKIKSGSAESTMVDGFGMQPTEEAKDRLRDAMDGVIAKKKEFSRRRMFIADEDSTYVNERNRHFNKKLQRAFGAYTEETRQNLERGTAL